MKQLLIIIFLPLISSCSVKNSDHSSVVSKLESDIKAGDSIDDVIAVLKRHNINPTVSDNSLMYNDINYDKQPEKTKEMLLMIGMYEIDLLVDYNIILKFNREKRLCSYMYTTDFNQNATGSSIRELKP